jgi:hypothetical protein
MALRQTTFIKGRVSPTSIGFSRAAGTLDPLGASVTSGQPRHERPLALLSPPDDLTGTVIVNRGSGTSGARVMGYDANSMLVYSRANGGVDARVQLFTGAPGDEENASEGVDLTTWDLQTSSQNFPPLNDHDDGGDASLAYQIAIGNQPGSANGGIRDNLIVVSGPVIEDVDTTPSVANGRFFIAYSTDTGANWTILHDETDTTWGAERGRVNGVNLVTGPFMQTDENGDEWCFFLTTDYKVAGGSDTGGGGELWLVGSKKTAGVWGTPAKLVAIDRADGGARGHIHSGGVIFRTVSGVVRMIVFGFRGDSLNHNAIESRWCALADWNKDTGGSTITEASAANTNWSSVFNTYGACGATNAAWLDGFPQISGVAPDSGGASLILGVDEGENAGIEKIHAADYDFTDGSLTRIERIFGWGKTRRSTVNIFQIAPDPTLNGGFVAHVDDRASGDPDDTLALYSPDGVHCGYGTTATAAVRGAYIYRDGISDGVLRRFARPKAITGRPLLLGRGGTNLAKADAWTNRTLAPLGGTLASLETLTAGEISGLPAKNFDATCEVRKLDYGPADAVSRNGEWEIADSVAAGSIVAQIVNTPLSNWGHRVEFRLRGTGGNFAESTSVKATRHNTLGEWASFFLQGTNGSTQDIELLLTPSPGTFGFGDLHAHHAYAVADVRNDGIFPGYPIAPGASSQPNEAIGVPLNLGSAWTVLLAVCVPTENWDRSVTTLNDQWTGEDGIEIARLVGDADNYIRIGLRCGAPSGTDLTNDEIVINGETGGAAFTRMSLTEATAGDFKAVRGSQILIGLSYDGTTLRAAGFWNQHKATADSETVTAWAVPLATLRECQASSFWEIAAWGVTTETSVMSAADMESALQGLPFGENSGAPRGRNYRDRGFARW